MVPLTLPSVPRLLRRQRTDESVDDALESLERHVISWLRHRHHLRWGWIAVGAGAGYLAVAFGLSQWVHAGGPEWLYLFVLVAVWSGLKLVAFGPVSVVLLLATLIRERRDTSATTSTGRIIGR